MSHHLNFKHYKRSQQRPFLPQDRKNTTILLGGLSTLADRFLASSTIGLGYRAEYLKVPDMDSMTRGKEFCDTGLCNPTYFTIGNLILHLENLMANGMSREEIIDKYVFVTAGSCGPCRFGMYEYEYRLALENSGFKDFRLIVFQMSGDLNQDMGPSGIRLDFEFFRTILNSVILSDHLNDLKNQIQPYEVNAGETDKAINKCADLICDYLENKKTISGRKVTEDNDKKIRNEFLINVYDQFVKMNLRPLLSKCRNILKQVEVDYSLIKPVVKITGEFWAQTTEGDGNYRIFKFLENEGCEIIREPVSGWVLYLIWLAKTNFNESSMTNHRKYITIKNPFLYIKLKIQSKFKNAGYNLAAALFTWQYNQIGKILGGRSRKLVSVEKLSHLAKDYMNVKYDGGEGFLEVAKNIYYTKNNLSHMVLSVKPFGCMPSTISDSIQAKVMSDFNNMIFLALETSGEGKINALSRVQMALNEARSRAIREYESAKETYRVRLSDRKNISALEKVPLAQTSPLRIIGYLKKLSGQN